MGEMRRRVVAGVLCLLMCVPGMARADVAGLNNTVDESGLATPSIQESPSPSPDPSTSPEPDPEEQELFDPELYDAPVPKDAYNQKLYILDPQTELLPSDDWHGAEQYGVGEMLIPRLFQYNYRKVICFYKGTPKSVATSGCGATSMSMIIAYLTGVKTQNPYTLLRWAMNNGMYDGSGLDHTALIKIGELYGVGGQWIKPDEVAVKYALKKGYPVIAHMGKGRFTDHGHYIVLRGLTESGRIRVNDPNNWLNSVLSYTYQELVKEARVSDPFMICYRKSDPDDVESEVTPEPTA